MVAKVIGREHVKKKIDGTDKEYEGYYCYFGTQDPEGKVEGLVSQERKFVSKKVYGDEEPEVDEWYNVEIGFDGKIKKCELTDAPA